jgi:hypothetical protein
MSFLATFKVDGKEYNVLSCNYNLYQDVDNTGRPSSETRGGTVNLIVESTDDTLIFDWMCDSYMTKDATLTFNKRDSNAKLKELEIKEAYCVNYNESFDNSGSGAMIMSFTLSARSIKMGEGGHDNKWVI